MSQTASPSGAELFLRNRTFFEQATCPGQLRCLGQNLFFWEICVFFLTSHLSRAASLPGAELVLKHLTFFSEQTTCPGQLRCLGQNFSQQIYFFMNKPLVPGSFAAWGRTCSQKSNCFLTSHLSRAASLPGAELFLRNRTFFKQATCPGQLRCLGQNCFSEIGHFFNKPLVPGSFAAWGRLFSQKSDFFSEQATCPGQLRCLGQNFFSEIGLFFEQTTCPGQLRCLGQNFFSKNVFFLNKALVLDSFAAGGRTFGRKLTFF